MGQTAQNLRDFLSLARMLRRVAEQRSHDSNHDLFVSTAVALEARAHTLAGAYETAPADLEHDVALYAPVNRLV